MISIAPKVFDEIGKALDKDRAEKEENWRRFDAERNEGAKTVEEANKLMDELKNRAKEDEDESKVLTKDMKEQGEKLREMAEERRRELQKLEKSIAKIDGLLQGLELNVKPSARLPPATDFPFYLI